MSSSNEMHTQKKGNTRKVSISGSSVLFFCNTDISAAARYCILYLLQGDQGPSTMQVCSGHE